MALLSRHKLSVGSKGQAYRNNRKLSVKPSHVRGLLQKPIQRSLELVVPSAYGNTIADSLATIERLKTYITEIPSISNENLEPKRFAEEMGDRVGFVVGQDVPANEEVVAIPEHLAITQIDAEKHETVGEIASQSSELTSLALFILAEKAKGAESRFSGFLSLLPECTLSPILWDTKELDELLAGSPVVPEAKQRKAALEETWSNLNNLFFSKDTTKFPQSVYGKEQFMNAFSLALAYASYLPSAECFALLPVACLIERTGSEDGCSLDYDAEKKAAVIRTKKPLRRGAEFRISDPRPNSEHVLATGRVFESNPSNHLLWEASLVPTDRYYLLKSQILEAFGFSPKEIFPVYADRFPLQLLSYLRLTRVQDTGLLAKVSFDQDVILSDLNEYEILQLMMGDCRDKLDGYRLTIEEEIKVSQMTDITPKERLACKVRIEEKKIVAATMDAVRTRLAPIRGIPTKQGLQDPNQDLQEIFQFWESVPAAPVNLAKSFISWAKGEKDPDWGKKPSEVNRARRPW